MAVQESCRHYSSRSTPAGDVLERCRLGVNQEMPFACPDDCVFFEPRKISEAGWLRLERPGDEDRGDADPGDKDPGDEGRG